MKNCWMLLLMLPALRAEPVWPLQPDVPEVLEEAVNRRRGQEPVMAWLPEDRPVRAAFLIVANSDSKHIGEHGAVREVAEKHHMAIVYMRLPQARVVDHAPALMDHLAEKLETPELKTVPWIPLGKSSQGKFPYHLAWRYPDRTLASISYHAETPVWPMEDVSTLKDQTIPHVQVNGETEWGGTWFVHARPSLLNYRENSGLLPHQVVVKGVDHGNYVDVHDGKGLGTPKPGQISVVEVWDYLALFLDKALSRRLPEKPGDPLREIDPSNGFLIDPFAVEDRFQTAHFPLRKEDGLFQIGQSADKGPAGFVQVPPAKGYTPEEGVPVVDFEPGRSPQNWLVTRGLGGYAMPADPLEDVSAFADLRPRPGEAVKLGDRESTFEPIAESEIGRRKDGLGGLAMKGGLQPRHNTISALAYTVLKVDEPGVYQVAVGHSLAVRVRMILNGVPLTHRQLVELEPGLYPVMTVIRFKGAAWGHIEPALLPVDKDQVSVAKAAQAEAEKAEAALAERFADGPLDPWTLIRPAEEVPEAEREGDFWIADRELAEAWLRLHDVERLEAERKAAGK